MAVLGKNTCSPARIYGPLPQTLFCGCSVLSFSVSAGWNEQASNLTVELVQDTCAGPRVWWDNKLNRQSSSSMADPGFTEPEPGVPVYFRIEENPDGTSEAARGGFEYAGLIEGWTTKFDANGNPVYTVRITDPRAILQNTQVIVNDYPGRTEGVWNLINAYAYVESLGSSCTTSPVLAFGGFTFNNTLGNISNERGMLWNDLKCAIHTLTSSPNRTLAVNYYNNFCRDNRLVYVGPAIGQDGYGVMQRDDVIIHSDFASIQNANLNKSYYTVDLTEIPFGPNYYRISGPNISLMEIISQVCQDIGADYYIELLPVKNGNTIYKVIKVRLAVRQSQPQIGKLEEFIAAKQSTGDVLSYVKGTEIRDEPTSIFLMGGKVQSGYETFAETGVDISGNLLPAQSILPYWGTNEDGGLIEARILSGEYVVDVDIRKLNNTLDNTISGRYVTVHENELRAALANMDTFVNVACLMRGDIGQYFSGINIFTDASDNLPAAARGDLPSIAALKVDTYHIENTPFSKSNTDKEKVYNFIKSYAETYYGKQFIVNAPFVCYSLDAESNKYRYSHMPTDSCWISDNKSTVLGLTHNSIASDFFRDDEGKYQAFVSFPYQSGYSLGGLSGAAPSGFNPDPTKLGNDEYIVNTGSLTETGTIWVKAEVNEKWNWGTPFVPSSNNISFVITLSSPVYDEVEKSQNSKFMSAVQDVGNSIANFAKGLATFAGFLDPSDANFTITGTSITNDVLSYPLSPRAVHPNGAFCPYISNVDVYGPWGVAGLPGQVTLEQDEGFVPWEYGSDTVMNRAALDKVSTAVTQMRKGERGSIVLAGFPNIPIGAELFCVDSSTLPLSQKYQKYVGSRTYSMATCAPILPFIYVPMNSWVGEYGPNITNINVSIGSNGFTTEYQFSTYTPRYGRFNKGNAERLKRIGQERLKAQRNLRAKADFNTKAKNALKRAIGSIKSAQDAVGKTNDATNSSSNQFIIGKYTSSGRPDIMGKSARNTAAGISSTGAFAKTAIMSMDGFFRPVSKSGDGDLPSFVLYNQSGASGNAYSSQPNPPFNEYKGLSILQKYLDPLANPSSVILTERSTSPTSGHDIEVLGRKSRPDSSWSIRDNESGYSSDYRFFALRGPILLNQWGYDTNGKPVPNIVDTEAAARTGDYVSTGLQDRFLDGWLRKPKTWPTAPIDLRLDRERGVWTVPQPPRILHVSYTGSSCIDDNPTGVVQNATVYGSGGSGLNNLTISGNWPWDVGMPTGIGKVPVYYDTAEQKHYIFPINRLDVASTQASGTIISGTQISDIKRLIFAADVTSDISGCQRDAFVHIKDIKIGVTNEEIAVDSTGAVTIYEGFPPIATSDVISGVWLDWLHGGDVVGAGKEVGIVYFNGYWRIMWAECEAQPTTGDTLPDPTTSTLSTFTLYNQSAASSNGLYAISGTEWVQVTEGHRGWISVTGDYTIPQSGIKGVFLSASGDCNITLFPAASGSYLGYDIIIKRIDNNSNTVYITGTETIDNDNAVILSGLSYFTVATNQSSWFVTNEKPQGSVLSP